MPVYQIPQGTRCEHCGMLAEYAEKGTEGAVHYFCSHHRPHDMKHGADKSRRKVGIPTVASGHARHSVNVFKRRFWICLVLTIPVFFFSDIMTKIVEVVAPRFFEITAPDQPLFLIRPWIMTGVFALTLLALLPATLLAMTFEFIGVEVVSNPLPLIFTTIIFFYGGFVFLKGAWTELKHRLPGMMTLIALAITVAYAYSVVATFTRIGEPLFWEIGSLITIMLLGHWIEMKAVGHASGALRELAKLLPDSGERLASSGQVEVVAVSELRVGDIVLVRPGAKVPADGEIVEGTSSLNESMITGESRPVEKKPESAVIAGTVNGEGVLKVKVTKVGEATALAGIMRLVAQAQASRSRVQALADRAAYWLTVIAVGVGAITTIAWLMVGEGIAVALTRTVAVLVIACPHALGLAVPLVASISTTLSARNGLLVREKLALELARKIDVVLFDKTGTLTKGEYGVTDIVVNDETRMTNDEILSLAAAVESGSEHPVAKAIVKAAQERGAEITRATDVKAMPGRGVEGIVNGQKIMVGGENLVRELGIDIRRSDLRGLGDRISPISAQGKTVVYVVADHSIHGAFAVADLIRPESYEAVKTLHKMGVKVAMVTGDAKPVAQWVAGELKIDEYFAEVLPAQKVEKVRNLQGRGMRVAMVGDGINDAPALAASDVGIAIGAGTDVAIESAGIILVRNDPRDVVRIIQLSRATYRKMMENLVWATGYNVFAIPAAAGAFIAWGIVLAPALAALLMSLSTVIVALNAQLLRKLKL